MILSAHQPAYLPWLGYFDKIARSDLFVILDSVQFEKNSFTNRNRIKTPVGPQWLTVPVMAKGHMTGTLLDIRIDEGRNWRTKHLKSIAANYRKAARFEECFPRLESLYSPRDEGLVALCIRHLEFWLAELGLTTPLRRSSETPVQSSGSDLVLDLCRNHRATRYISGTLGRNYLDAAKFHSAGIEVEFQEFLHPTYDQLWGAFIPNMCVIDWWMSAGGQGGWPGLSRIGHSHE